MSAASASAVEGAASGAWKGLSCIGRNVWKCFNAVCGIFSRQIKKLSVRTVSVILRVFNFTNAILMAITCFFSFKDLVTPCWPTCVTRTFLAVYMGVFSIMLFSFEARFKYTEKYIRRLFGFMFTWTGRAVFLIFIGAICFGMIDSSQKTKETDGYKWCVGVGCATLANAIFNCFIICSHPGFQKANAPPGSEVADGPGGSTSGGPAAGDPSKLTDEQIRAYLEAHPELAAAAAANVRTEAYGGGGGHTAVNMHESHTAASAEVQEWSAPAPAAAAAKPSGGSGGGGFFGFGGGKKKGGAEAAAPAAEAAYAPPTAAFTGSVTAAPAPTAAAPRPAAAAAPAAAGGAAKPAAARAPVPEEDNPFASSNPFG